MYGPNGLNSDAGAAGAGDAFRASGADSARGGTGAEGSAAAPRRASSCFAITRDMTWSCSRTIASIADDPAAMGGTTPAGTATRAGADGPGSSTVLAGAAGVVGAASAEARASM